MNKYKIYFSLFTLIALILSFTSCSQSASSETDDYIEIDSIIENFIDNTRNPCVDFNKYVLGKWIEANPVPTSEGDPVEIYYDDNFNKEWFRNKFRDTGGEPVYDTLNKLYKNAEQYENADFYKTYLDEIDELETQEECLTELEKIIRNAVNINFNLVSTNVKIIMLSYKLFDYGIYYDSYKKIKDDAGNNYSTFLDKIEYNKYTLSEIVQGYENFHKDVFKLDYLKSDCEISYGFYYYDEDNYSERFNQFWQNVGIKKEYLSNKTIGIKESFQNYLENLIDGQNINISDYKHYLRYLVIEGANEIIVPLQDRDVIYKDYYSISRFYIEKKLSDSIICEINKLIENIYSEFTRIFQNCEWLCDSTKEKCISKLNDIKISFGKPNSAWNDSYKIDDFSRWINYDAAIKDLTIQSRQKLYKAFDDADDENSLIYRFYSEIPAYIYTGYSLPSLSTIFIFPGTINSQCYNTNRDDAYNYGGIGYIIAHEIAHCFNLDEFNTNDNQLTLTPDEEKIFREKMESIIDQYDKICFTPNHYISGEQSMNEIMADLLGLEAVYNAMLNSLKDFSKDMQIQKSKKFFYSLAFSCCSNELPEYQIQCYEIQKDTHPLNNVRINSILSNFTPWYEIFAENQTWTECDEWGNLWYREPEDRIKIF